MPYRRSVYCDSVALQLRGKDLDRGVPCLRPPKLSRQQHEGASHGTSTNIRPRNCSAKFGVPVPAGFAAFTVEEAVGPRRSSRTALRRQGADPRRRPRQGQVQGTRPPTPRAASASPDRSTKSDAHAHEMLGNTLVTIQTGEHGKQVNRLYVDRRRRHRQGILPRDAGRPRHRPHRLRRLDRRRHGHRERRARHAREDHHARRSIRRPASCRITAAPSPAALEAHGRPRQAGRAERRRAALRRASSRTDVAHARNQPAGRSPRTASCWCSTPR